MVEAAGAAAVVVVLLVRLAWMKCEVWTNPIEARISTKNYEELYSRQLLMTLPS